MLRVPLIPRQQSSPLEGLPATEVLPLDCLAEPTEAVRLRERYSRPGRGECWKGIRLADEFRIDDVDVQPTLCEPVSGYSYLKLQHDQAPLALLSKRKKSKHIAIGGCSDKTREAIEKGAATEAAYSTAEIKKAMRTHSQIYITDPISPNHEAHTSSNPSTPGRSKEPFWLKVPKVCDYRIVRRLTMSSTLDGGDGATDGSTGGKTEPTTEPSARLTASMSNRSLLRGLPRGRERRAAPPARPWRRARGGAADAWRAAGWNPCGALLRGRF